jgi:hypothetical protein
MYEGVPMSSRKSSDSATLTSRDQSVVATVTLLESEDNLHPLVRIHVVGHHLKVVEFWVGTGADGSDIDIDLAPTTPRRTRKTHG